MSKASDALIITLHSANPQPVLTLELPGQVLLRDLLPELVRALQLPATDQGGQPIPYQLVHPAQHRLLGQEETLHSAGVMTGNELFLVRAAPPKPAQQQIRGPVPPVILPPSPPPAQPRIPIQRPCEPPSETRRQRVIAFWSGPAGGTGQTTLALALAAWGAERQIDTTLLGLSEPALCAYLHLDRRPNATDFFASGHLAKAKQTITWSAGDITPSLPVILGPTQTWTGPVKPERIGGLVKASQTAHEWVILDLPPLTAGGNPWAAEPLRHATDLVLVAIPTVGGIAATVEAWTMVQTLQSGTTAGQIPLAYLLLNQRSPGGLSVPAFMSGIRQILGNRSLPVVEIDFLPSLSNPLDRGSMIREKRLSQAIEKIAREIAGPWLQGL